MDKGKYLMDFFQAIHKDARVGPAHISIYVSLLHVWFQRSCQKPFIIFGHDIKQIAKINSRTTYHRCLKDLAAYGYLQYEVSFKKNQGSNIDFILSEIENVRENYGSDYQTRPA